ncbi:aspartate aminotransferase family protein [Paenibacillus sp. IB182496]|uniref:Aspartate aminotransferase family protein n=1 Tax=Paenibacillus sabuli TaxID=2772509 RepID=A0A927BU44_9BACL|nr:aspartate aminotransferase family protein [Paenibacillus sabuli]
MDTTAPVADEQAARADARELAAADRAHLWHAMTPYNEARPPMIVAEGQGAWIADLEGNRFLDAMSGLWCVNVGYGREELARAAYEQMKTLAYYPLMHSHEPAIRLAERLSEWLEDEYVVFFSNSGSEANETAFKIARQYQQQIGQHARYKVVSRYRAYHGNTMGALAATGQAQRKYKYEPLAPGFVHVRPPDPYRRPEGMDEAEYGRQCARELEETIRWEGAESVAAVIMEPVITGGGMLVPPPDYLRLVREACDRHGVLLIVDEVICGFGRSGRKFGHQNYDVKPDIVTMAKGLTSGYLPLSATAVRRSVYEAFQGTEDYEYLRHVNTFGGSPAACALALANLELLEREQLVERSRLLGERLRAGMEELREHPLVGDIRSFGLLLGIELVADKQARTPLPVEQVTRLIAACKARGLIIGKNGDTVAGYNNVLTFAPPLASTDEDLAFLLATFKSVMHASESEG